MTARPTLELDGPPGPAPPERPSLARTPLPRGFLAALGGLALAGAGAALAGAARIRAIAARRHPRGLFVSVPGGRMHVLERPAGGRARASVVLLHGASGNAADPMLALAGCLAPDLRLVAPDRPGQGFSDRPGGRADAAPAAQANRVAAVMEALGTGPAVIVGHSWSGALALALALDRPDLVSGLVIVAGATHPWPGRIDPLYRIGASAFLARGFAAGVVPVAGPWLMDGVIRDIFAPQPPPPGYAEAIGADLALRPAAFLANAQDIADLRPRLMEQAPRYPSLRVPTVVVTGDRDRIVWPSIHARPLAAEIPGARLIELAGVGHMPHHARPEVIAGAVEEVLRGTSFEVTPPQQATGLQLSPSS